jgi:hypothetical protein
VSFTVAPFSETAFYEHLTNKYLHLDYIKSNLHRFVQAQYIAGYLDHLDAKTIVVEQDYVDRDYMADYAAYYATCMERYGPHCRRLHFFSKDFSAEQLAKWIGAPAAPDDETLNKNYLGFVVVRPLPEAAIGRTVLKTYQDAGVERHYPAIKTYEVNLFGIKLSVKSLAYQQQDTVIAACATVALWSGLHQAASLFHTPLLRPMEITRAANRVQTSNRIMPSTGLRIDQMCAAIRRAGLEPLAELVNKNTLLMSMFHGYLSFGLPVIVLGYLAEADFGAHAVTVSGYSLSKTTVATREEALNEVVSIGRRIEKVYLHDDNLGPFARTVPIPIQKTGIPEKATKAPFGLQEQDVDGNAEMTLYPFAIVVPVYEKIRITYSEAHAWVGKFCVLLKLAGVAFTDIEWSIGLTTVQNYKTAIRSTYAHNADACDLLTESLPRFLWRAVAKKNDSEIIELLIDATGISRSCPLLRAVWHDRSEQQFFNSWLSSISKADVADVYTSRFADAIYP